MNHFVAAISWILDPNQQTGPNSVWIRVLEHLGYSSLAIGLALLIALPLGIYIGHTGKWRALVVSVTGGLRSLPSLGLLTFLALTLNLGLRWSIVSAVIALAILAIPALLAATYSAVESIPPQIIDGARGAGHSEMQIARLVELPLAARQIVGGIRSASLQVLASATIAAYLGLGGLGRYIFDGLAIHDYPMMLAGSILVIALALVVDYVIAVSQRRCWKEDE